MRKLLLVLVLFALFVLSYGYFYRSANSTITFENTPTPTLIPFPTRITPTTGLPDYHLIRTTFIPQAPEKNWDQPWQDACEEAALLTVDYYYKKLTPSLPQLLARYQQLFEFENGQNWLHDVNLLQMSEISKNYLNYDPIILENPSIGDLKKSVVNDVPVIVTANGKTLYRENKHFKSGGPWYHALVILGYDDRIQKFIVHDVGTQFGAYFQYSYDLLIMAIHDLPDSRNKEEIDSGSKKALVLIQ